MEVKIIATGYGPTHTGHIGTVVDVIAADLPESLLNKRFKASDYAYGFELASCKEKSSIGDSVLVNGFCYVTSTKQNTNEYQQLTYGPDFISGGVFLIPKDAKPSHQFHYESDVPMDFMEVYNKIYETVKMPFTFVALTHFLSLQGTSIGKAPIDKDNIFACKDKYYPYPNSLLTHTNAFVMGVAANFSDQNNAKLNKELETVLYNNPSDVSSELNYHAHLITLNKPVKNFSEVIPEVATKVLHLFAKGSTVTSIKGDIYTINAVEDYFNSKYPIGSL